MINSYTVLSAEDIGILDQYRLIATGVRPACCLDVFTVSADVSRKDYLINLVNILKKKRRDLDCCNPIIYDIGSFCGFAANQRMVDVIIFANSLSGDNPIRHIILGLVFGYSPIAIDKFFKNDLITDYVI